MAKIWKTISKMEANPNGWRMDQLKSVADALGIEYRTPGGSHVTFVFKGAIVTVPAKRPIKPVYVRGLVKTIRAEFNEE